MSELITIQNIPCYEENGIAHLNTEVCARGLGFTTVATSGNEVVRWQRVFDYLESLDVATYCKGMSYQEMCPEFIPENIFYRLAMKAKNEAAEAFQAKIADEVIPTIRKHGMYATPKTVEAMLQDPDTMIKTLQALKAEREQRKALEVKIEQDKPFTEFGKSVEPSSGTLLIREFAKIASNHPRISMGEKRLYQWLRDNKYLMWNNEPYQSYIDNGWFKVRERTVPTNHGNMPRSTTLVTGKGQIALMKALCRYFDAEELGQCQMEAL